MRKEGKGVASRKKMNTLVNQEVVMRCQFQTTLYSCEYTSSDGSQRTECVEMSTSVVLVTKSRHYS